METNQAQKLFHLADELVNRARQETTRAKDDVVQHLICSNTRNAIANYLKTYLIQHELSVPETTDLNTLLIECQKANNKFYDLDLTPIDCRFEYDGREFCTDTDKVRECFSLAEKTRSLIIIP